MLENFPQSDTEPVDVPTTNSKSISWKNVIIGVLIGAILIGLGAFLASSYFYPNLLNLFLNQQPTNSSTTYKTATTSSTPSAQKDETADWKTYTNKTLGFSVKYPSNWSVMEDNSSTIEFKGDKSWVAVINDNPNSNSYSYISTLDINVPIHNEDFNSTSTRLTDILVDGHKGVRLRTVPNEGSYANHTLSIEVGQNYSIVVEHSAKEVFDESVKILDLMLPTFKFLD